jgi:hypothetical protein
MSDTDVTSQIRYLAPYLEWAKTRPYPELDLAGSNILACSLEDLPGARDAVALSGANDTGYAPLMDAIAARYGTTASRVTTASGTSGANFLVCAALLRPDDDVLVEGRDTIPCWARPGCSALERFASSGRSRAGLRSIPNAWRTR